MQALHNTLNDVQTISSTIKSCVGFLRFVDKIRTQQTEPRYAWHRMNTFCETRFSEYCHRELFNLLDNIPQLLNAIPLYLNENIDNLQENKLLAVLKKIANPEFIGSVFLLNKVFSDVSITEVAAQHASFGPFDLEKIIKKFKNEVESFKNYDFKDLSDLLVKKIYRYQIKQNKSDEGNNIKPKKTNKQSQDEKDTIFTCNLNQIENVFRTRNDSFPSVDGKSKLKELKVNFNSWIDTIIDQFSGYLDLPEEVVLGCSIFNPGQLSFEEKFENFRSLFEKLNIKFKPCSDDCLEIHCDCLLVEFKRFMKYFEKCLTKDKQPKKVLMDFFNNKINEKINDLKCINSMRLVEAFLLLKASQSSCERIMSILKKVVDGRYEGTYKYKTEVDLDMVNLSVILSLNSSFATFNTELAAEL